MLYCIQDPLILNHQSISFHGIFPLIFMTNPFIFKISWNKKSVGVNHQCKLCWVCTFPRVSVSSHMQKHQTIIYHQSISTPDLWAVSSLQRTERKIQRNNDIRVTEDDIDKWREIGGVLLASLVPHPMNSQTVKWQRQEIPDATVSTWRLYYEVSLKRVKSVSYSKIILLLQ